MRRFSLYVWLCGTLVTGGAAAAFNPDAGAETTPAPRMYRPLPARIVPVRYYDRAPAPMIPPPSVQTPPTPVRAEVPLPPLPMAPATPVVHVAPIAPIPSPPPVSAAPSPTMPPPSAPRYIPAEQFYPAISATTSEPVLDDHPRMADAMPVGTSSPPSYAARLRALRTASDRFSIGIEGFYSEYREDIFDLKENGPFGSITAGYTHYFTPRWFGTLDLRGSYGQANYESVSGTIDNIKQWETENRLLGGYDIAGSNSHIKPYAGLGFRYFSDESKGTISNLGAEGYDRRIFHLYLPIGVTYEFTSYGLDFAPNVEIDPLLWGNVSSRLGTFPGESDVENRQTTGLGLRGEFLFGQLDDRGSGWQIGPFVRYWYFPDSEESSGFIEPENSRLQAGAAFRYLF